MENLINQIQPVLVLLELALLLLTLLITTRESILETIRCYQIQCIVLSLATALTALKNAPKGQDVLSLILMIFFLPIILAFLIERLLSRATIYTDRPGISFGKFLKSLLIITPQEKILVEREWRSERRPSYSMRKEMIFFFGFLGIAFITANQILPIKVTDDTSIASSSIADMIGLTVSLSLHMIGLYNTVIKRDIITQVIGLLIMDHGLYLAVVKIVAVPVPAQFFVTALYFYTLITIIILVLMVPRVRQWTNTINLDEIYRTTKLTEQTKDE